MSLRSALRSMSAATAELSSSVDELVITVHEDRPVSSELAVVDHLAEVVSEFQAGVMQAADLLAGVTDARLLPERLPEVDEALRGAALRYWRELRSYEALAELRWSARGRDPEWRAWQGSVEASQLRCEIPLADALAATRAAWREIGELLALYLPGAPVVLTAATSPPPAPVEASRSATTRTQGESRVQSDL